MFQTVTAISLSFSLTLASAGLAGPQRQTGDGRAQRPENVSGPGAEPAAQETGPSSLSTLSPPVRGLLPGAADAVVRRDISTGQVRRVQGNVPVAGARNARQAAEGFLRRYSSLMGFSAGIGQRRIAREVASPAATYVTYEQTYRGLPVFDDQLTVQVGKDLAVMLVNNDMTPITRPVGVVRPRDPEEAIAAAVAAVREQNPKAGEPTDRPTAEAGVIVNNGAPIGVWRVRFSTFGAAWSVLINAATGNVISVRNLIQSARQAPAYVFSPNPIQSSGVSTFDDNNNADQPALDQQRQRVMLRELDDTGFLQGTYASTAATKTVARAKEPTTAAYNYPRSDTRFEEVMAYYWITESTLYIRSLGFTNINDRQIEIDIHYFDPRDPLKNEVSNAYYFPWSKGIVFGTAYVDAAEDADVIMHEYGHSVQDNQSPGFISISGSEARAMSEGFGDYWAASFFDGLGPMGSAQSVYWAEWWGRGFARPTPNSVPPYLRRLDGAKIYPRDMDPSGQEHNNGEIWSAALWQVRAAVGRRRADTVILESHFALTPRSTFTDGANAIITANRTWYRGADEAAIRNAFVARGILAPAAVPPPPTTAEQRAQQAFERGLAHFNGKRYTLALTEFKETVTLKPDYPGGFYYLADSNFFAEKWADAAQAYRQGLRYRPGVYLAHYRLGYSLSLLERFAESLEAYRLALSIKADDPYLHTGMGYDYIMLDRYAEAVDAYRKAIALDPSIAFAHGNLGWTYSALKRYAESVAAYKEAVRLSPNTARYHYGLGLTYALMGDRTNALAVHRILQTLDAKLAEDLLRRL